MIPTRQVYWNIDSVWLMFVLLAPALAIFTYGIRAHIRRWRIGKAEMRSDRRWRRLASLARFGLGHQRLLRSRYAGLFHSLFFAGFAVLLVGTLVVVVHEDFGLPVMQGPFYLYFQSLTLDIFGVLAIVGILMAIARRLLFKPARLDNTWRDAVILPLLLAILATGFTLEGLRIVATNDIWAHWSPVGRLTGQALAAILPPEAFRPAHASLWWFHLVLVFGLIASAPYTKLRHILAAPANIYFRSLEPKGAMIRPVDLDTTTSFGVNTIDQFTWKGLLDLDACTECGRCQDACPAFASGKPLSPKSLILDLRRHLHDHAPRTPSATATEDAAPLIGNAIQEETIWACTTCMACMEACPVFIEHVPKVVDLRRFLVMEEGRLPDPMQQAMRSLESRGQPYAGNTTSRLDWCKGLDVRVLAPGDSADYLYWVGCSTALNTRNHRTARAFTRILQEAGINFGILGNDEHCTGDCARRVGNEYLFQTMARQTIATIESRKIRRIVTTCPHCLNAFKNDYRQLGARFDVYHHTQLLAELIEDGRWQPADAIATVTYHDPCYLGRYNDAYDEPRVSLAAVVGTELVEMPRRRENSFCCGAGGGRMWADEPPEKRVSNLRAREALSTGADILSVACPFCMTMLEEAIASEQGAREMKVLDVAEVLWGAKQA